MTAAEIEAIVERLIKANAGEKKNVTWTRLYYLAMVAFFSGIVFLADLTANSFLSQMATTNEQIKIDRDADAATNLLAREVLNKRMLARDKTFADQLERVTTTQDRTIERLDDLTQLLMEHD